MRAHAGHSGDLCNHGDRTMTQQRPPACQNVAPSACANHAAPQKLSGTASPCKVRTPCPVATSIPRGARDNTGAPDACKAMQRTASARDDAQQTPPAPSGAESAKTRAGWSTCRRGPTAAELRRRSAPGVTGVPARVWGAHGVCTVTARACEGRTGRASEPHRAPPRYRPGAVRAHTTIKAKGGAKRGTGSCRHAAAVRPTSRRVSSTARPQGHGLGIRMWAPGRVPRREEDRERGGRESRRFTCSPCQRACGAPGPSRDRCRRPSWGSTCTEPSARSKGGGTRSLAQRRASSADFPPGF